MFELHGDFADRPILDVLRVLHERGVSGVLEIDPTGHRRRLFFRDGELYLPGGHPLARRLAEQVAELSGNASRAAPADREETRRRLLELIERIVDVLLDWRRGAFQLIEGREALPADLVGPLPTRRLLMVGGTQGAEEGELVRRLGGESARLVATPAQNPASSRDLLGFSPEEHFLLERLRTPMRIEELLRESPMSRAELARRLAQLMAIGLVRATDEHAGSVAAVGAPRDEDAAVVQRLGDRIARALADEPVSLEPEAHRARLADLLARSGGLNFYELLEVSTGASSEEVHAAYERLAKLAHPSNARRLGLVGRDEGLRLLFDRATRAYVTLIDPERRRVYNQTEMIELAAGPASSADRAQERRQLARQSYEKGITYAAASEFHFAAELLGQAVRTDPRAEYWMALGRVQARNPNWIGRAVESFRAALELEPDNPNVRFALAQLFEQIGDLERARVQYASVVRLAPQNFEAAERLAKLTEKRGQRPDGGGLFDRIFRRN